MSPPSRRNLYLRAVAGIGVCNGDIHEAEGATDAGRDPALRAEGLPPDDRDREPPLRAPPVDRGRGPVRRRALRQEVLLQAVGGRGPAVPGGRRLRGAPPHALELPPPAVLDGGVRPSGAAAAR